jgi:hypothetical protein
LVSLRLFACATATLLVGVVVGGLSLATTGSWPAALLAAVLAVPTFGAWFLALTRADGQG